MAGRPLAAQGDKDMLGQTLPFLIACLLIAAPATGKTYRWVNEEGVTVYSQTPPAEGEAEVLRPPPPPPTGAATRTPVQERLEELEAQRAEQEKKAREQARAEQERQRREANCRAARRNLEALQGPPRRLYATAGGEFQRFTEEERQARIEEAREQVEVFCEEE
jgi:hypothetical protein